MLFSPVIVSLPIADRETSFAFYSRGLDLQAIGELADDGVPEPLQFVLNDGVNLMLVPAGGFGWVLGDRKVAERGSSECLLVLRAATNPTWMTCSSERSEQAPSSSPNPDSNRGDMPVHSPTQTVMSG